MNELAASGGRYLCRTGPMVLWRGTSSALAIAVPTVGIYLPCYDLCLEKTRDAMLASPAWRDHVGLGEAHHQSSHSVLVHKTPRGASILFLSSSPHHVKNTHFTSVENLSSHANMYCVCE